MFAMFNVVYCSFESEFLLEARPVAFSYQMSHSLNSLKGGYIGDYIGDYYRAY